jgi:hypothetical protein
MFPRCVIIHSEQLLYVRLSVEKGGCHAALRESGRQFPIFTPFFWVANFGLLTSGSPTFWHLEIVVKPKKRLVGN